MIKQTIDAEIKTAMLSGDKELVSILRTVKSAILDVEVNSGARETGLAEDQVIVILQKEQKKRTESALLYKNANDLVRAEKESHEAEVIAKYLPELMSEEEVSKIVDEVIAGFDQPTMQQMGQVIGEVKKRTCASADGSLIAQLVKKAISA